ncbi:MAG: hypothetical protein HZB25_08200 [Candidatus Eisenbacteria bacterium]|nr:hypothetical protein [Candidatus Eisenbacteria bacterium]
MLLPFFWLAVQVAMVICGVGYVARSAAMLATGAGTIAAFESFTGFIGSAVGVFGVVTLAFALADLWLARSGRFDRWRESWDPRRLPRARRARGTKSLAGSVSGLLVSSIFSAWWLLGLKAPVLVLGPAAALFTWGPVWERLYPMIVVVAIGRVLSDWVMLVRPLAAPFRLVARLLFSGGELAICYLLFRARDLVVVVDGLTHPAPYQEVAALFNAACSLGLMVGVVIGGSVLAWRCGKDVVELVRGSGETGAGGSGPR